ncbi:MAG: hypothetical protein U0235_26770 [Polyangiaceae bacterium]
MRQSATIAIAKAKRKKAVASKVGVATAAVSPAPTRTSGSGKRSPNARRKTPRKTELVADRSRGAHDETEEHGGDGAATFAAREGTGREAQCDDDRRERCAEAEAAENAGARRRRLARRPGDAGPARA